MKYNDVKNFIGGRFIEGDTRRKEVINPANNQVISSVPLSNSGDVDKAVQAAENAFPGWKEMTSKSRSHIFYNYRQILSREINELAEIIQMENGKTIDEAEAEVNKGIELTEFACSLPQIAMGENMEVSQGVRCQSEYVPLGVVACINPFNFPLMVPHWTIPNALMLGNCMIAKPSELTPLTSVKIAEMFKEAGLPDGVLNFVNGDKEVVEAICDHPGIKAVSFVGSTEVAKTVYRRASSHLKRCLALGGAKNHLIVLPDANQDLSASDIAASMCGSSGQRCMAASVMISVGNTDAIVEKLCLEVRKFIPGDNLPPLITPEALEKIIDYIDGAEKRGADILVDGRKIRWSEKADPGGNYMGGTIIDWRTADGPMPDEEVFGPVLEIIEAENPDEAIKLQHSSPYGNACSVFTQHGEYARKIAKEGSAGMIGVNIGVPVPREPFSFGGVNMSKFGQGDITGKSSVQFWTDLRKITSKWAKQEISDWMS